MIGCALLLASATGLLNAVTKGVSQTIYKHTNQTFTFQEWSEKVAH